MAETAYIGLGVNLGDRAAALRYALRALEALAEGPRGLRCSRVWATEPRMDLEQPEFLNMAAALETSLTPAALLAALLTIEEAAGRIRDPLRPKGPRVLDLDLLLLGEQQVAEAGLILPHPGLATRRFVLAPLADLAPTLRHPLTGAPVESMLAACPDEGAVRPLDAAVWTLE